MDDKQLPADNDGPPTLKMVGASQPTDNDGPPTLKMVGASQPTPDEGGSGRGDQTGEGASSPAGIDPLTQTRLLPEEVLSPDKERPALGWVDRYALRRCLGQGGFGAVYLADDTVAQIQVALKTLPGQIANNPGELERTRENFALVQKLAHPYIANLKYLHRIDVIDIAAKKALRALSGDYLLVMEYVAGSALSDWRCLFPARKVPLSQALQLCSQIASALDYAHAERIVHRDIKPANVMVMGEAESLRIKVLDFGLAAEIRSSLSRVSKESGSTSGTPLYMSPEQWLGQRQGAASDQYSLAVLFYELISGEVPFAGTYATGDYNVMANAAMHLTPQPLEELSRRQNAALLRALAKNPSERFASCGDFVVALGGKRLTEARVPRSVSGHGGASVALRVALVLVLLLALVISGGYVWRQHREERARQQAAAAEQARRDAEQAALAAAARARIESSALSVRAALAAGKLEDAGARLAELTDLAGAESAVTSELRAAYESQAGEHETNARYGKASVERDKAAALDAGQGFAARQEALEVTWREAEAARQSRAWGQALSAYDKVLAECRALQAMAIARRQAAGGRDQSDQARKDAVAVNATEDASKLFDQAATVAERAAAAFAGGDFAGAEKLWSTAAKGFANAGQRAQAVQGYRQAKASYEQALAPAEALLKRHGGNRWQDVLRQSRIGAASEIDPAVGLAAYRAAQEALPAAIAEARERERAAQVETVAVTLRERMATATAAQARADWAAALAAVTAERPEEPFVGAFAAEPLRGLLQQLAALEKEVRAGQRAAEEEARLAEARERERAAQVETVAVTLRERMATATAAQARADWAAALAAVTAERPEEPFVGAFAAEPLRGLLQQLAALEKEVRAGQRAAEEEARLAAVTAAQAKSDRPAVATEEDKALVLDATATNAAAKALKEDVKSRQLRVPDGFSLAPGGGPEPYTNTGWAAAIIHEKSGIELVYIPAGSFIMGSPKSEQNAIVAAGFERKWVEDESQHQVTIPQGFYLGKYEVTQAQWEKVTGKKPSFFKNAGATAPVEDVTWDDCQAFCKAAGSGLRLPLEAEWEYACRARTTTALYNGDIKIVGENNAPALDPIAWYGGNSGVTYKGGVDSSGWSEKQQDHGWAGTHPVGRKEPNAWGLYDMIGNVWEWCQDKFETYPAGPVTLAQPAGAVGRGWIGSSTFRVLRGGSWSSDTSYCRSAYRGRSRPDNHGGNFGLRVACSTLPAQ